jgi:cyanophycinase
MFAFVRLLQRRKSGRGSSVRAGARRRAMIFEWLESREVLSATAASVLPLLDPPATTGKLSVCHPVATPTAATGTQAALVGPEALHFGPKDASTATLVSQPEIDSGSPSTSAARKVGSSSTTKGPGFVYYRDGNQLDKTVSSLGGLAMMGGGKDVDQVFTWMGTRANGGDFLVLGTTGKDVYNSYINRLNSRSLNSVSTLIITSSAAATNPLVLDAIDDAEAIFIEGGDQSTYVGLWQDNAIEDAINAAVNVRHVSIGGTSAGLAVMGQYVFSAANGTAYSNTVLANPYDPTVTLDTGFLDLPYMENTITDSHFYERDRMGRLDTFLARLITDYGTPDTGTKGIGIAEQTALLVETVGTSAGVGTVVANKSNDPLARHVYFLETVGLPQTCLPNTPLTFAYETHVSGVSVHRASAGDTFELDSWTGSGGVDYTLSAVEGVLSSSTGSIY